MESTAGEGDTIVPGGTKCRKSAELIERWSESTAGEGDTMDPGGTKCRKSAQ